MNKDCAGKLMLQLRVVTVDQSFMEFIYTLFILEFIATK